MQSENGVLVDIGQIRNVVESADVFVIGFAHFAERLLVDTRTNARTGPMIRVVKPLGSVEERLFWLGRKRGSFGMPESFTFFGWPHSTAYLRESGIWQRIIERVCADFDPEAARQCDAGLARLRALEHEVVNAAIKGERFVTIWPAEPGRD